MFVAQVREVGGFDLQRIQRAPRLTSNLKSDVATLVYHGSRRRGVLSSPIVALRLIDMIDFRGKKVRFKSRSELCAVFQIDKASKIILTGVDHDARIERWWSLGENRASIIRALCDLGVTLATTPNFSLLLDNPRMDDLHAMSRIAIIFSEFQNGGLACALHPNSRTARDFERWATFVSTRPEVATLAYEFTTGSASIDRKLFHVEGLIHIARVADRPLDVVVRGAPDVIRRLRPYFREVILIDTAAFIKAQKRRTAEIKTDGSLFWEYTPTDFNADIDLITQKNVDRRRDQLRSIYLN